MHNVWYLLGSLLLAYLLLVVFMYWQQPAMVFLPHVPGRQLQASPADAGMDFESIYLDTASGERIHAWFVPLPAGRLQRGAALFFHGNAGNISHRLERLALLQGLGFATLIIDYRGYGQSEGRPSEAATYEDAEAAWQHLVEQRGVAPEQILIMGQSLGAAVAAYLASRHVCGALVLEAAFRSLASVAQEHYPWLPVRPLLRIHYPVRERLREVRSPVLVVHSREDAVIGFDHGVDLYASAYEPKEFLEIQGDHDQGFLVTGERYTKALADFLERHGMPLRAAIPHGQGSRL